MAGSIILTLEYEVEVFYHGGHNVEELIPDTVMVHTQVPKPMEAFLKNDALDKFYQKQAREVIEP